MHFFNQITLPAGPAKPGKLAPLPYIPVLNPYDLAMLFSMLTVARVLPLWHTAPLPLARQYLKEALVLGKVLLAAAA